MENLLSIMIGMGLSAACGFRVFVPMLILSIAGLTGQLPLAPGFEWIATWPALLAFATATLLEVLAYYLPWIDHLLDLVAGPAALIAGVLACASVLQDLPPLVKWSIALIGGGGMAGIIQGATTLVRLKSTLFTGGLGNPIISTLELAAAITTSLMALFLPPLGLIALLILLFFIWKKSKRFIFGRTSSL
jgi:hypothetical protein